MRSLFWSKIPDKVIDNTVWGKLSDSGVQLDVDALEGSFCKALARATTDDKKEASKGGDKPKEVSVFSFQDTKCFCNYISFRFSKTCPMFFIH